jgi:hypothetical protein
MAATDDTTKARSQLAELIEAHRAQLMQAHGVLMCSYEVLLHAEGDHAIYCTHAADVAANLINKSVEDVDLVRVGPLIDASKRVERVDESSVLHVT